MYRQLLIKHIEGKIFNIQKEIDHAFFEIPSKFAVKHLNFRYEQMRLIWDRKMVSWF